MRIRTFCSITIIPTLILILLLLSSVDNYLPENQVYGQVSNSEEVDRFNLYPIVTEASNIQTSEYLSNPLFS
ncbi:MAG TPA: hypothetical protein VJR94_10155 [Candidatus Nitrosocosmicus sp.]|nr:hypothetical protein [Candidatus Nitrosocosmicus sp.]